MFRMPKLAVGAVVGAAAMALGATPVLADHYRPLSPNAIVTTGVSQFNYVNIGGGLCSELPSIGVFCSGQDLALKNPVHDVQIAATLFYTHSRTNARFEGDPNFDAMTEVFLECRADVLTPHASLTVDSRDLLDDGARLVPDLYAEVIWAPMTPVTAGGALTRVANGLGGRALAMRSSILADIITEVDTGDLAHPALFSLPFNLDPPYHTQRGDAVLCVCGELTRLKIDYPMLDPDMFLDFGFDCPQDP